MGRVLIAYAFARSGHHAAARAIAAALRARAPATEIRTLDFFRCVYPRWSRLVETSYMGVVRNVPLLWRLLYDGLLSEQLADAWKHSLRSRDRRLPGFLAEFRPDVVVCTQASPFLFFSALAARGRLAAPVVGVVTDFVPHRLWVGGEHGYYVVPTDAAAGRLALLGVSRGRIRTIGIPVDLSGAGGEPGARAPSAARRVLILGGSFGLNLSRETVQALDTSPEPFDIHVVCGLNGPLRRTLAAARGAFRHAVSVWGYVGDVPQRMRQADLIVTKPGGMTTAEALALRTPLVLLPPLPGQEQYNRDFLTRSGAAAPTTVESLESTVTMLLRTPAALDAMRGRAAALGRPDAARDIAGYILLDLLAAGQAR